MPDFKKISTMVEEGKLDLAKAALEKYFEKPLSGKDEAAAYLDFALLYLKVKNGINERYLATLEDIAGNLERLGALKKDAEQKIGLAEVRAKLQA